MARPRGRRAKGTGGLSQLRTGPYAGWWVASATDAAGTTVRRKRRTEAEAVAVLKALLAGRTPQKGPARRDLRTWGWLLDEVDARLDDDPHRPKKPRTLERYRDAIAMLRHYIQDSPVADTDEDWVADLQKRIARDDHSVSTVKVCRTILSLGCRHAQRRDVGLLPRGADPVKQVKPPPADKPKRRALTAPEAGAFLAAIRGHRLEVAILAELLLGLRRGEVLAWDWSRVDLEAGVVDVSVQLQRLEGDKARAIRGKLAFTDVKTDAGSRALPLPSLLVERLRERWEAQGKPRGGLCFPNVRGRPLEPRRYNYEFDLLVQKAGVPRFTPHELRHSLSSVLQAMGVPLSVVSGLLGHGGEAVTTRHYTHRVTDAERAAIGLMDKYVRDLQTEAPAAVTLAWALQN